MTRPTLPILAASIVAAAIAGSLPLSATPASARPVCGWYEIIYCSTSEAAARHVATNGWGEVIDTDFYDNLVPGKYCVVSGPQTKLGAKRDRVAAIRQGYAGEDAYIKRACVDSSNQPGE